MTGAIESESDDELHRLISEAMQRSYAAGYDAACAAYNIASIFQILRARQVRVMRVKGRHGDLLQATPIGDGG
jgi:hypothetical protein